MTPGRARTRVSTARVATTRDAGLRAACGGFTLIEALVATVLMGVVLGVLATLTAQWLPNWDRGFVRVQRAEMLGIALDRLAADIAASQFVTPHRDVKKPLFDGTERAVTFVRTTMGPNLRPGLDVVRVAETVDNRGRVLARSRAPFAPFVSPTLTIDQLAFADPVALLREPLRMSFAYAGADGTFVNLWQNGDTLPSYVRLIVRDATTNRTLSVSTATVIHVELPSSAVCSGGDGGCGGQDAGQPNGAQPNGGQPNGGQPNGGDGGGQSSRRG